MKLAVMQPYFAPYIGYFQLLNSVDKFVIYDDVNFIKGGYINRNSILLNDKAHMFTIPLKGVSSFKKINEIALDDSRFEAWKEKFFKTIEQAYKKAPHYLAVLDLLNNIFSGNIFKLEELCYSSLLHFSQYLEIDVNIIKSSTIYNNAALLREERLIDICKQEGATIYINPIGGQQLYKKENFAAKHIILNFIKSKQGEYHQFGKPFVGNLSIIDVLMFNSVEETNIMLDNFELV